MGEFGNVTNLVGNSSIYERSIVRRLGKDEKLKAYLSNQDSKGLDG